MKKNNKSTAKEPIKIVLSILTIAKRDFNTIIFQKNTHFIEASEQQSREQLENMFLKAK